MAKNGKKLSVAQKNYVRDELGLDPQAWLSVKWTPKEIVLQNRETGELRTFPNNA